MEKLIPLLNERHNLEWVLGSNVNGDYLFVKGDKENKFYEEQIISKKFGFIQRLVEHNKLLHPDFVQHLKLFYGDSMPESNFYLMMLSIADRPIYELNKMLRP